MDKNLFFYELEGRGYIFQNKKWDEAKHGFEDDMLNMAWEMWSSAKHSVKAQAVPECTWSRNEDYYFDTSCGNNFMFTECEDKPSEHQFKHCCYCGGKLIEAQEQTKSTGSSGVENIHKAAELIWYDNGMINQFEPLRIKLDLLNKWLLKQDNQLLKTVESELSALNEEDLTTVCCGEESEQERLASPAVNDFLCRIFNEEYEAQEQKR